MRTFIVALLLAGALLWPVTTASAAAESVSGSFAVDHSNDQYAQEQRGDACFVDLRTTFVFTSGQVAGQAITDFDLVQSAPCPLQPGATKAFTATGTFSGTVLGAAGSFDFTFDGQIDAAGQARGQLTILQGTGWLANLHGHLTLEGTEGVGGTYTGAVSFGG